MDWQNEKCVMVIDESLPLGIIANTAAIMGITLGKKMPEVVGADVTDQSGKCRCHRRGAEYHPARLHSRSCHWNKAGIQVGRVCPKRLIYVTIRGRNRRGTEAILATASANGQFLCERAYHQFAFGSARQFADGQGANAFRDRTLFTAPAG